MQQNPVGDNLQVYASLSTLKVEPPQNEMTKGVVPLDTLPAGWWNWLWNAITQAQNDIQYSLETVYQEINAVLAHAGITPNPEQFDQLKQAIIKLRTQIATAVDVGGVLSTEMGTNGSVKVAADGKMTVNGFGDLQQLQTLVKDTLVEAINEVFNVASALDGEVGDLTTLATENKTTIVSAINELKEASGEGAAALEGKIGNMDNLQTSAKDTLVSAINEVNDKEITLSGQISPRFTYVVDSDQALKDWANNVEGNDYTSVLIRKGTWTSDVGASTQLPGQEITVGVNLTTTDTKVIVGEPESKLVFSVARAGLIYESVPATQDYWMRNVQIELTADNAVAYFTHCANLTNCHGVSAITHTGVIFNNCTNLIGCTGTNMGMIVFGLCTNLLACSGSVPNGYSFYQCDNITNCVASNAQYGFFQCKGVSHCKEGDTPCTTALFGQSYSSLVEDERFLCNGTSDGGFNGTDIPDVPTVITPNFTYEVDSDEALRDWADNAPGNDYTVVLIRRGAWTSTVGVNLTTSGTEVVVGEAGSRLEFTAASNGLFYDSLPEYAYGGTRHDYWMRGVNIVFSKVDADTGSISAFSKCVNLTNCSGELIRCVGTAAGEANCFNACVNLTNCTGRTNCVAFSSCSTFSNCDKLVNCSCDTQAYSDTTVFGNGFSNCTNITNCIGVGYGATSDVSGYCIGNGFSNCVNLINCTGSGSGSGVAGSIGGGNGYYNCTNVTNCTGSGSGIIIPTGNPGNGYGFRDCKRVSGCKKSSTCTTSVFSSSYASFSGTPTYACADTPNGGFNDPTN